MAALLEACRQGRVDEAIDLINQGLDVNISDKSGNTPLTHSCRFQSLELVTLLLSRGANVNPPINCLIYSPLMSAILTGDIELATLLLDHGANVNVLVAACDFLDLDIIELLLDRGANINEVNEYGESPLHILSEHNDSIDIVRTLINRGADINIIDENGDKALDRAREHNNYSVIEALVHAHGHQNPEGLTQVSLHQQGLESVHNLLSPTDV
jgi:ankyrin repeat protein